MTGLEQLAEMNAIARLRERDVTLFSDDVDQRIPIMQRLGWTDLAEKAPGRLPLLEGLARALVDEGASDLLLLGMGGSSLAPLVMERVIGGAPDHPRLHVLDTTSPVQVSELLGTLDPLHTYVLIASKSGTTIEPLTLYAIVREWFSTAGMTKQDIGRRCAVITDPGSPLEKLRQRDLMRTTLTAPATVGGRYSALSMFGLAPAALIGIDMQTLITRALAMEHACAAPPEENPAGMLAAWMADAWESGRDKLTLVTSPRFRSFGLWAEQLIAESLGKDGKGIVPVIEHEPTTPTGYGDDRAVVVIRLADDDVLADWSREVAAEHPVFELTVADGLDLGGEFVRWEYAVALTGILMGVNPFNELAVAEAKAATEAILEGGGTEVPSAQLDIAGTWVTYAGKLEGPAVIPSDRVSAIRVALGAANEGDYFAFLLYAPEDDTRLAPLRTACATLSRNTGRAVCLESGPRYLHSTGQLHKDGPNSGVFIMVTARDRLDIPVPGKQYSLGALHRAQAEGDLVTLSRHDRRILRLDLPSSSADALASLAADLSAAIS